MTRTKLVCTLGPRTEGREAIAALADAGMDVARLNFSHGTHKEHGETIARIRAVSKGRPQPIAILQDLCGPKIRTGPLEVAALDLRRGDTLILTTDEVPGNLERVSVSYSRLPAEVSPGDQIVLADGDIELEVEDVNGPDVRCRVTIGGKLAARKGIHVPGAALTFVGLTEKDHRDLLFGVAHGVDLVAVSFVRSAADVRLAKSWIREAGGDQPVIAKIEKREALACLDEIIAEADGLMVARGDLGLDVPLEEVPLIQKRLIFAANAAGIPVITATQMLRSMVDSRRPTRAEVTDVANAILDGTDAVMLSEETATGCYPVAACAMLRRIARAVEGEVYFTQMRARPLRHSDKLPEVIAREAVDMADALGVRAIVCPTLSGQTARRVSRYRPRQPILAISPDPQVVRRLALSWGVHAYCGGSDGSTADLVQAVEARVRALGLVSSGDRVVFIGGYPAGVPGATNFVRVDAIG